MQVTIGGKTVSVQRADRFFSWFRGLMFKKNIDQNKGLLLIPCSSIHMFFMRFAIDAVYLDRNFRVLGKETVSPWRIGKRIKGTHSVLELASGTAASIQIGDILSLEMDSPTITR